MSKSSPFSGTESTGGYSPHQSFGDKLGSALSSVLPTASSGGYSDHRTVGNTLRGLAESAITSSSGGGNIMMPSLPLGNPNAPDYSSQMTAGMKAADGSGGGGLSAILKLLGAG